MSSLADVGKEYAKDLKLKKDDIEKLKTWAEKQPHLPKLSELQYILFLQSCYYSNEQAKLSIENFFTFRTLCKEMFSNENPKDPSIQMALNVGLVHLLPKTTTKNYKVIFLKLLDTNADNYIVMDQIKMFDMAIMLAMHVNGTNDGISLVMDMDGSTLSHLLKLSPNMFKKLLFYVQEALPIRLKEVHIINVAVWIDKVLAIIKPFMKKELFDVIYLHSSMESLYDYVAKEILPKDYDGTAEYIEVLAEQNRKLFEENCEFFKDLQKQITDESKRTEKGTDYNKIFGMEGTFKKLEVD